METPTNVIASQDTATPTVPETSAPATTPEPAATPESAAPPAPGQTPRRHRKVLRNNLDKITKRDLRRLARRGGIKRINTKVYDEARGALKDFLQTIVHDAVIYTEFAHRRTVTAADVRYALKRNGRTLYDGL